MSQGIAHHPCPPECLRGGACGHPRMHVCKIPHVCKKHASSRPFAGSTSAALTKDRPWLQSHLSTVASVFAIVVGVLIGLAGMGYDVPLLS